MATISPERPGRGKLKVRRRVAGKFKPSSSRNTGSAGRVIVPRSGSNPQESSPQESIQPDFIEGSGDDSSWQPDGWDEDNSGYDEDNPESKAEVDDKDASNAEENGVNEEKSFADAENNASPSDGQDQSVKSDEEDEKNGSSGWRNKVAGQKQKVRGGIATTKKRIAAIIAAVSAAAAISAAIIAGPGIIINHISDLISGKIDELSNSHQIRYRRTHVNKIKDMFSKDGRRAGAIISEMESRGYKFAFNKDGTIQGLERPNGTGRINGTGGVAEEINLYIDRKHPFRTAKWKTKRMEAFYNRFNVKRVSIVEPRPDDLNTPESTFNKNMYEAVETRKSDLDVDDTRLDAEDIDEDARAEIDGEVSRTEAVVKSSGEFSELENYLRRGGDIDLYPDQAQVRALREASVGSGSSLLQYVKQTSGSSLTSKSFGAIKNFATATDIADKMCIANKRMTAAQVAARTTRAASLLRASTAFLTASDGVRTGAASAPLIAQLMKRIMQPDFRGQFFGNSTGVQYASTGLFSRSRNETTQAAVATNGKLTGVFATIKNSTKISGCALWQNPFFQVGQAVGQVVLTVFTGGGAKAALATGQSAVRTSIQRAIQTTVSKSFAKNIARGVLTGLAIDITFDQILNIAQLYAERSQSLNFFGQEQGMLFGDIQMAGAGVANKQQGLQAGLVPATVDDYTVALAEHNNLKRQQWEKKSFFARLFDYEDFDSLLYRGTTQVALASTNGIMNNIRSVAFANPLSVFGSLGETLFGGRAYADDDLIAFDEYVTDGSSNRPNVRLATDPAGNLLPYMPNDILSIDPDENIQYLISNNLINSTTLEPKEAFADHVELCVNNIDTISVIEGTSEDDLKPENDCLAELETTKRFKAHLAYLSMVDGYDAFLFPSEISQSSGGGSGTTGGTISEYINGPVVPCEGRNIGLESEYFAPGQNALNWEEIASAMGGASGIIGQDTNGSDMMVFVRDACAGVTNPRTIVIASSIHGSENGGQRISFELLFNAVLPDDVRVIAIPEVNKAAISSNGRNNPNGVNLNRNFDYRWGTNGDNTPFSGNYRGPSAASEAETQNVQNFLTALGPTNAFFAYHDCINKVFYSGEATYSLSKPIAEAYTGMIDGGTASCNNKSWPWTVAANRGYGFMEAWYADTTGSPALLVELNNSESASYMKDHADVVVRLLEEGIIR